MVALGKEKFLAIAPPFTGDILWEHLEILQKGEHIQEKLSFTILFRDWILHIYLLLIFGVTITELLIDCEKNVEDELNGYENTTCRPNNMENYLGNSRNSSQDYSKSK